MDMPENQEVPRAGRYLGVRGALALGIALGALVIMSQAHYLVSRIPAVAAVISSVLVELTNADRDAQGLATLTVSPLLTEVAEAKAADMAEKGYFAHTSPEGKTPWHWFKEKGYQFTYAGENLAVDFGESADVERAWMQSPTHRANIVGTQFSEIGIAVRQGTYQGRTTTFVVQVFGAPAPKVPPVSISDTPVPTSKPTPVPEPAPRPVREIAGTTTPETVAVATTLPTTTPVTDVLGQSAGAYLKTVSVPWWYRVVHFFL